MTDICLTFSARCVCLYDGSISYAGDADTLLPRRALLTKSALLPRGDLVRISAFGYHASTNNTFIQRTNVASRVYLGVDGAYACLAAYSRFLQARDVIICRS